MIDTRPKEHPSKSLEGMITKSRRCRQRYARKRDKEKSSALQKRINVDLADLENRRRQITRLVQEKLREIYGLLPDEQRSAKKNALLILTTMEKWFYFCRPTNLAFHDITIGKVAPRALPSLLVLGVNFCPTPFRPTLNIEKSMERFERDLHIRSVFAGSEELIPLANPKINVQSKWKPPAWDIFLASKQHLPTFRKAL